MITIRLSNLHLFRDMIYKSHHVQTGPEKTDRGLLTFTYLTSWGPHRSLSGTAS
ncbi:hypothetical protein CA13_33000 [Planctomycetes bacterium CA13]|uniref:Uncharacterized protein n=1 Tax=Novipirellula herctigrandis TaxID=2527986 RepID=A0A5C5Z4C1_9BACT|nr:hypothetical protein CA13_33000 [Planctomycetes bacterium CA13]